MRWQNILISIEIQYVTSWKRETYSIGKLEQVF